MLFVFCVNGSGTNVSIDKRENSKHKLDFASQKFDPRYCKGFETKKITLQLLTLRTVYITIRLCQTLQRTVGSLQYQKENTLEFFQRCSDFGKTRTNKKTNKTFSFCSKKRKSILLSKHGSMPKEITLIDHTLVTAEQYNNIIVTGRRGKFVGPVYFLRITIT